MEIIYNFTGKAMRLNIMGVFQLPDSEDYDFLSSEPEKSASNIAYSYTDKETYFGHDIRRDMALTCENIKQGHVCYLFCVIKSRTKRKILIQATSNHFCKLWLNSKLIAANMDGLFHPNCKVIISPGDNIILIEVPNLRPYMDLSIRLSDYNEETKDNMVSCLGKNNITDEPRASIIYRPSMEMTDHGVFEYMLVLNDCIEADEDQHIEATIEQLYPNKIIFTYHIKFLTKYKNDTSFWTYCNTEMNYLYFRFKYKLKNGKIQTVMANQIISPESPECSSLYQFVIIDNNTGSELISELISQCLIETDKNGYTYNGKRHDC